MKNNLVQLIKEAEELGLDIPADVIRDMTKAEVQELIDAQIEAERLPIYTMHTRGAVPPPREGGLVLGSSGWEKPKPGGMTVMGTGISKNHNLLRNLDYASAAHTGFEPTITLLLPSRGGTGVANADANLLTVAEPMSAAGRNVANTFTAANRFDDKVAFTQADGNEYIDSLADGYMDYRATTAHRFNTTIETSGGRIVNTTRVTTTYTVLVSDHVIYCDTDGGAFTATLPAGVEGQQFKIINCGSSGNSLTVDGNGAETVYGELTQVLSDGEVIDLTFNATEGWW